MRYHLSCIGPMGLLISLLCAATATPALGAGGGDVLTASSTEYMLVFDPAQAAADINERLQAADFAEAEEIIGLPSRYSHYRLIEVDRADAGTKAALLAVDGIKAVRPVYRGQGVDWPTLSNGQVIATFQAATTLSKVQSVAAAHGCSVARQITGLPGAYVFNVVNEAAHTALEVARGIATESGVRYAHPDLLFKLDKYQFAAGINDPYYPWQWHLENTGQVTGAVPDADVDAPEAWTLTLGEGAVVAVIDDSHQPEHEDLSNNYVTGYDFLEHDDDPLPSRGPQWYDEVGQAHGIAVTGLICAEANDIGVRGVAPSAQWIGCKIGLGYDFTNYQDIADAFLFAERNGAMVINNSWGPGYYYPLPGGPTSLLHDAINYVATQGRDGLGVLVMCSSGNSGSEMYAEGMAAMPTTMAIGATLRDDSLTCYSSYGPAQSVVAPGGGFEWLPGYDIPWTGNCFEADMTTTDVMEMPGLIDPVSLYPMRGYNPAMMIVGYNPYTGDLVIEPDPTVTDLPNLNYTRHFNGTSAACPVATGVAALVFSVDPGLSAREARNIIEHTADKVETDDGPFDEVTGHNDYLGHGRVNAYNAVQAAWSRESWPSPVESVRSDRSLATVALTWKLPDWDADGTPDEDVTGVLVVQGPQGQLRWHPTDGQDYLVGQRVAEGVTVVANEILESLALNDISASSFEYALFTRNMINNYAWGRRANFGEEDTGPPPEEEEPLDTRASVRATPMVGGAPLAVQFAGGGVTREGEQFLVYNWDFGDGAKGSGPLVNHTYASPGTYLAKLTATTSAAETASAAAQIVVLSEPNEPPTARIGATPRRGAVPLVVILEADASDSDGAVVRYEWDFGDGSTGTGRITEHVYLDTGIFIVTLTVTDDMGASQTVTEVVTVTSDSLTAAATVPDSEDASAAFGPFCATGVTGAMTATLAIMLGLTLIRRRW